jgi:hypothetical protein
MPNYKLLISILKKFECNPSNFIFVAVELCSLLKETKHDFSLEISTMEIQMGKSPDKVMERKLYDTWLNTWVTFKACDFGKIKDIVRDEYEAMLETYLVQ